MQIGVIGLGRMGGNISPRVMKAGHHCVGFDVNVKPRVALAKDQDLKDFSGRGRDRGVGTGGRAHLGALCALPLAAGTHFRRRDALGYALRLRWHIEGNEPIDPEPKPKPSQPAAAQGAVR